MSAPDRTERENAIRAWEADGFTMPDDYMALADRLDATKAELAAAREEAETLREALTRVRANARSWHGPPNDGRHESALVVIAMWCDAALAAREETT